MWLLFIFKWTFYLCFAPPSSQKGTIAIRILSFEKNPIDKKFWISKLKEAVNLRRMQGLPSGQTTAYRLVFGEGDRLPGLILDWYDGNIVMQCHSIGMYVNRKLITEALADIFKKSLETVYC